MHISPAHTRLGACGPWTNNVLHGSAKAKGQDVNVVLFAGAGAGPTVDFQIRIYCHPDISFHANFPTSHNRGTCLRDLAYCTARQPAASLTWLEQEVLQPTAVKP